jgi:hypothetical protein
VVDVTVTTLAGTSAIAGTGNDYAYGLPTVTALNPTGQATTAAGTAVTLTGTNFVAGATVAFGASAATGVVVVNATTITCVSPAHAPGVADVTVTTLAGTSAIAGTGNDYTYWAATKGVLTSHPSGAVNGVALTGHAVVQLQNASSANVSLAGVNVVATISSGTGALSGTTTVATDAAGAATFTNLIITGTIGSYTLTFTPTGLTAAVSNSFTLTVGAATKGVLTTQPSGAVSGAVLTGTPIVQLQDSGGNNVSTPGVNVVATISSGTGALSGTTTVATVAGVATFSNLIITGAAGPHTLTFTPTGLTAAVSNSFPLT